MIVVKQSANIRSFTSDAVFVVEEAGRVCYKSEMKIDETHECIKQNGYISTCPQCLDRAKEFIRGIIKRNHTSVLEHASMTVKFVTNRGLTHEIVRHRLASYSQESTRYCNYCKDKFGSEISVIEPYGLTEEQAVHWKKAMQESELAYFNMVSNGSPAEIARGVLPTDLKTEIVMTANIREWRHVIGLRMLNKAGKAHPQIVELFKMLAEQIKSNDQLSVFFEDII